MSLNSDYLAAIDAGQAGDALIKIERAFNIKLRGDVLKNVKSLDDLCDAVCEEIKHSHAEGCTTQQAFYRFRNAYMAVSPCNKSEITPACKVKTIFPCENRAEMIEQVEEELGLKVNILKPKLWITVLLISLFAGSLFVSYNYGVIGAIGLLLTGAAYKFSTRFCSELNVRTVGDLVAKVIRDNHLKGRRGPSTVNRKEVETKLQELFVKQPHLEPVMA